MKKEKILCQDVIDGKEYLSNHIYPFDTLPPLVSHLHPKFIILDAESKLESLGQISALKLINDFPIVSSIMLLYSAWSQQPRAEDQQEQDPLYNAPIDHNDNDNDY